MLFLFCHGDGCEQLYWAKRKWVVSKCQVNKTLKNKLQKHDTFTTSILFFLFGQPKWNTTHGPAAACLSQALLGNRFPHPFKLLCPPTGRVSLVRTTALRLEALQMDDQGSYDCRILLLNESADELQNGTWIRLSVTGKALNLEGFFVCLFVFSLCCYGWEWIILSFARQEHWSKYKM